MMLHLQVYNRTYSIYIYISTGTGGGNLEQPVQGHTREMTYDLSPETWDLFIQRMHTGRTSLTSLGNFSS